MPGLLGLGGGSILCDQISQKGKVSSSIHLNTCKYYVCGIKLETKVIRLHKIRVEISLFHLKKCVVNYF